MLNASNNELTDQGFYIADWFVEPASCQIQDQNKTVHLEPKVMDLLVYLALNPGQVHSREKLLDDIWHGVVVSDEALTNAIIKLRKAFNDNAKHPQFIETLPKRGYRLIAPVRQVEPPGDEPMEIARDGSIASHAPPSKAPTFRQPTWLSVVIVLTLALAGSYLWLNLATDTPSSDQTSTQDSPLAPENSIAVLPFINTGNDIEHSYFSDGLTDDLITDLSKLSGLFVIARNSTFQYKGQNVDIQQVASSLGVRYLLQGSVRRSDNRVRVNVQLINGQSGRPEWSDRYDGALSDVFALQDQITGKIISSLRLQLTDQDRAQRAVYETTNPEAYDEFLKGYEYSWRVNRESFAQAEKHFVKALELDPSYSRANAALALLYLRAWTELWHENSGSTVAGWVRARKHLDEAMKNPTPLAYRLVSAMKLQNRRYDEAIAAAEKAVALDLNNATGYLALAEVLSFSGQPLRAIENTKKALRLDPNFPAPYLSVQGRVLYDLMQYKDAIEDLERAIASNPRDRRAMIVLIAAHAKLNQLDAARNVLQILNQNLSNDNRPEFTLNTLRNSWPYSQTTAKEHLYEGLRGASIPEW